MDLNEKQAVRPDSVPLESPAPLEEAVVATSTEDDIPFSIYAPRQKLWLSAFAGIMAFLSPLSANIYFPVLPQLSKAYGRSSSSINLSITLYMVFQGVAPMFSGSFADASGRRPAYLVLFTIYIAACLGLALQNNYIALLLLRCIQSSGCSGMVAIASGVVSDIATRKDRGGYMGIVSAGALLGPAIGPIIGGIIGQKAGWRWIFWFLVILGGICAICEAVFVPETSRKIVGNGSAEPPLENKSLLQIIRGRRRKLVERSQDAGDTSEAEVRIAPEFHGAKKMGFQWSDVLFTLRMFLEKDIVLLLFSYSIVYSAYYCVLSSLPTLFEEIYGYDTLQTGLCFIPIGVGMWASSLIGGRILDYNYKAVAKKLPPDTKPEDFPIEQARLSSIWGGLSIVVAAVICYGWVLHQEAHVAIPLILSLLVGVGVNQVSLGMNTLIVDLYPTKPSSITAANNLTRCVMGAAATGLIDPMLHAMGRGWCFTFIGCLCICTAPFLWMEKRYGKVWRRERETRIATSGS